MSVTVLMLMILEIILMIGIPIALAFVLKRRWSLPWRLAMAGAATFIASQILHIPANSLLGSVLQMQTQPLIVQAIILGLSAGIFEEVARYVVYRVWQKDARSWRQSVFFGLGHGGIEAILLGLVVALTLVNVIVITTAEDPSALGLPTETLEQTLGQVKDFWSMPLYMPALAVAERLMALVLHISLSTLVVLCFHRSTLWPLFAAILWHALADTAAFYTAQRWGNLAAEGALLVITLGSIGLLWLTHRALPEVRDKAAEA
ncbi:MAG: YhfC family intramembrane metalloprotease [Anaerolineae bacterium]